MEINLFTHETKEISTRQRNINIRRKIRYQHIENNFPTKTTHSTYNTQTYKRQLKNTEKFQRIGNTEETYTRAISNQTSLLPGKPENSTLTPIEGIEKSRDQM